MFQQSMLQPLEPPQYFITQFNALVGGLGSAYFPFTTSILEQAALFLLKLREALCWQAVPLISREASGRGKVTQSSPLIPFNPALGNWKWCVFPHTTHVTLKEEAKYTEHAAVPQRYRGTHCGTQQGSGCGTELNVFWIFQRICNHKPSIEMKIMYLFLITAVCLLHFPSDTTKIHQANQQVTGEPR